MGPREGFVPMALVEVYIYRKVLPIQLNEL